MEDAKAAASALAARQLELDQATAENSSLQQQLQSKQQAVQQLQEELEAGTAKSDRLQRTLEQQTASLAAERQQFKSDLEAQLKQVTGQPAPGSPNIHDKPE